MICRETNVESLFRHPDKDGLVKCLPLFVAWRDIRIYVVNGDSPGTRTKCSLRHLHRVGKEYRTEDFLSFLHCCASPSVQASKFRHYFPDPFSIELHHGRLETLPMYLRA